MTVSAVLRNEESASTLDAQHYLGQDLLNLVLDHFTKDLKWTLEVTEERLAEVLKFLFLSSCYPACSEQKFFPLTKEVDEIWHYLIIQTREYNALCLALPGRTFIHHRSIPFSRYTQTQNKSRAEVIHDFLRWIPIYTKHFGPFTSTVAKHWKIIGILQSSARLSLGEINIIGRDSATESLSEVPGESVAEK